MSLLKNVCYEASYHTYFIFLLFAYPILVDVNIQIPSSGTSLSAQKLTALRSHKRTLIFLKRGMWLKHWNYQGSRTARYKQHRQWEGPRKGTVRPGLWLAGGLPVTGFLILCPDHTLSSLTLVSSGYQGMMLTVFRLFIMFHALHFLHLPLHVWPDA